MPISDSDLIGFMQETAQALGRIESGQQSTLKYLDAVAGNVKGVKDELETHKEDGYAHGIGVRVKVFSFLIAACGLLVSVAALWSKR